MEKHIENIFIKKEYTGLSGVELRQISDWAKDEENFNHIKKLLLTAGSLKTGIRPPHTLKTRLMADFTAQTASKPKSKMRVYARPLLKVAAVLLLLVLIFPFLKTGFEESKSKELIAENKTTPRTENTNSSKQLQLKPDTKTELQSKVDKPQETQETPGSPSLKKSVAPIMAAKEKASEVTAVQMAETVQVEPAFTHADLLLNSEISSAHAQILQEQPQLLDMLYTAF